MGRKLYVGNLPFSATAQTLESTFGQYGTVELAQLVTERETGRSRGFAFVEMRTDAEAQDAITNLNGADLDGRALKVNEAKPQEKRNRGASNGAGSGRGW